MGGAIALQFALAYPEMVRSLLLCDTTADIADTSEGQPQQPRASLTQLAETLRGLDLRALTEQRWLQWAQPLGLTKVKELPEGVRRHIERVGGMSPDGLVGTGAALQGHHVLDRVSEIAAPTLILTGDRDFLRSGGERIKERLPDARFVLIKGAAHISSFWQPEKFTTAVLDFLADVEAGRPVAGNEER
jgi:pimeloyl-ACP methyl ester carboxylesterase